ncbi:MAG: DUF1992 domain-containing protein [Chloroflexota bacterium]
MTPSKAVDAIIQEAIARGEFDNLPGKGKPVDLSDYFNTPEEVRLAYSVLKSADVLPEEAEILKEITILREELSLCGDETLRLRIRQAIDTRLLKFNLLMERHKTSR